MNSKKLTMNIGIISFMVIFVILCLVIFSVLSLASANSNVQSTQKSVEHSELYYQLSSEGEKTLKTIDDTLENIYHSSSSSDEYFQQSAILTQKIKNSQLTNHTLSYEIEKDEVKLYIEVEILYPGQHYYRIITWKSVPATKWNPDLSIDVL